MNKNLFHHATLENGLSVLCETMPAVRSAAYTLLVPAGAIHDHPDRLGSAAMLAEWISRGAAGRSGSELLGALDELGVSHGESAQTAHLSLSGVTIARSLLPALSLTADMVRCPHLDDVEVEPIRALLLQGLRSVEDDPASKIAVELRRRHYPDPWGRPAGGTVETLEAVSGDQLRAHFAATVRPRESILAVAGAVAWEDLLPHVERCFGAWDDRAEPPIDLQNDVVVGGHLDKETQQIQVAAALRSVPVGHSEYYEARAAASILGGYSSSRLFTEVREKRGLCYSIYAGFESLRDHAAIVCQAGTAPDRAQETLDVLVEELLRLRREGVAREELETMRAGLKSSLVMQQESSASRAAALAGDWYFLGRVRTIAEIAQALDALTAESVSQHCRTLPIAEMTLLTLGPTALRIPSNVGDNGLTKS